MKVWVSFKVFTLIFVFFFKGIMYLFNFLWLQSMHYRLRDVLFLCIVIDS